MKNRLILLNICKILFSLIFIILYIFVINKIYNTNIWVYKSFVLFMVFILIIYLIFNLLNKIIKVKKEMIAKIIDIKNEDNLVKITYQYLDNIYYQKVDFYEYDQNKYFKYKLYNWYTLVVENNKVVKLLDPALEPVILKKEIDKNNYRKLKYGIPIYLYYIYEFLFLINIILFPLEVVLTEYKINIVTFILIEIINIILFFLNSKIIKNNKK